MAMPAERRPPRPLDAAALDRLALRYVERFATTQGKLADYLRRKVRERGWEGEPADPAAIAARMAALGYVDDRLYAESKAAALARRGLGARRVGAAMSGARSSATSATQRRAGADRRAHLCAATARRTVRARGRGPRAP
jgi:regulatory protein